jgi:cell wall-associated NlpC family hydrolase
VPLDALRAGDLLFFRMSGEAVDHVGIYDGAGQFLHAPGRGRGIERARFDAPWYRSRLVAAGRFWSDVDRFAVDAADGAR